MGGVKTIEVGPDEAGLRLDRWFKRRFPGLGHGRLEKLLRTGQVRVDGGRAKAGLRLAGGERVRVPPLPAEAPAARRPAPAQVSPADARELAERVLHRDAAVLVLDKPPGLAVQGGSGTVRHLDAMLDALRFGASERPRLVHRLDKDTSGILVLGRSAKAAARLAAAFKGKRAAKLYWAVVAGVPIIASEIHGTIGLLGQDFSGYFPAKNTRALRALLLMAERDPDFVAELAAQGAARRYLFTVERERAAWAAVLQAVA